MSHSDNESDTCRNGPAQHAQPAPEAVRQLFLDLEDTVITPVLSGWQNTELINIQKVRAFMADFKPDSVHIFSFAIWNEHERNGFSAFVRPMLERALGVTLGLVPTVDTDIIPVCCKIANLHPSTVDFQEMSNFWGKQGAFRLVARHHAHSHRRHSNLPLHLALLDDAVYNEQVVWPDLQTTVEQWNIDEL